MEKSYDKMSRDELLAACVEMIIGLNDDEFAIVKAYMETLKEQGTCQ